MEAGLRRDYTSSERRDMALWSFPIVFDVVRDRYAAQSANPPPLMVAAAFSHTQLWQARILDDGAALRKAREELRMDLQMLDLPPHLVDEVDEEVLGELMDVVTQRFHRSPMQASICAQILLNIATNLAFTPQPLAVA